jgi:hypothetical protein
MGDDCDLFLERIRGKDHPLTFCMAFNANGRCNYESCKRRHVCVSCKSATHGSYNCTHALVSLINLEFDGSIPDVYPLLGNATEEPTYVSSPVSIEASDSDIDTPREKKRKLGKPCLYFNKGECANSDGDCLLDHFCTVCESEDHGTIYDY